MELFQAKVLSRNFEFKLLLEEFASDSFHDEVIVEGVMFSQVQKVCYDIKFMNNNVGNFNKSFLCNEICNITNGA